MSRTILDIAVLWGPIILLIAVWLYFVKRSGTLKQPAHMELLQKLLNEQVTEAKKLNEKLDRIVAALEKNGSSRG